MKKTVKVNELNTLKASEKHLSQLGQGITGDGDKNILGKRSSTAAQAISQLQYEAETQKIKADT